MAGDGVSDVRLDPSFYRSEAGQRYIEEVGRSNYAEWPVPVRAHFLDTRYVRTFVAETGARGSPPLVIFHGMTSNSSCTHLLFDMAWLSELYNVYSVDTLGDNGWSAMAERPRSGLFYSSWIIALLEQLGVDRPALLGVSYGAFISLQFAAPIPSVCGSSSRFAPCVKGGRKCPISGGRKCPTPPRGGEPGYGVLASLVARRLGADVSSGPSLRERFQTSLWWRMR